MDKARIIQRSYHHYKYEQRKRQRKLQKRLGCCDLCIRSKAGVYAEFTQQKLCKVCYHRTMEIMYSRNVKMQGRVYDVIQYRSLMSAAGKIQHAWCRYQQRLRCKFGQCVYCSKSTRIVCGACKTRTCRTCSQILHSVSMLKVSGPLYYWESIGLTCCLPKWL